MLQYIIKTKKDNKTFVFKKNPNYTKEDNLCKFTQEEIARFYGIEKYATIYKSEKWAQKRLEWLKEHCPRENFFIQKVCL